MAKAEYRTSTTPPKPPPRPPPNMKRCPQCSFLYLDSDLLCDLDQTPLISDDFGTDVAVIEHSNQKAGKLWLTAVVHERKLNLKTLSAATVGGLIIGLTLLLSYQRMRPTLQASQAPPTSQAQEPQASRASQVAEQVSTEVSANVALAQQDGDPQRGRAGSPAEQRGPRAGSPRGVQDLGWGAIPAGVEQDSPVAPDDNTSPSARPSSSGRAKTTPNAQPDSARRRVSSNPVSTSDVAKSGRGPVTIRLANGSTLQADEVWRTKAGIWYRRKGIVTFLKPNRVRAMNN